MDHGSYDRVVELLAPVAEEPGTASLLFLLEDARSRLQSLQQEVDASLQAIEVLTKEEHYAEAIKFLESQAPALQNCHSIQTALTRLRQAHDDELAALQAVGKAYAALDHPEIDADPFPGPSVKVESLLLTRIVPVYTQRRKSVADRELSLALEHARTAMEAGDTKQAARALKSAKAFASYASSNLQNEWQALNKQAEKSKFFGR
jgi:hypothetical protein